MRKLPATALSLVACVALVGGLSGAAVASVPGKDKAPVQIPGDVNDHGTGKIKHDTVDIEAGDFYFEKTYIKGEAGTTASFAITNEGSVAHTFTIDAQDIDEELQPGDSIDVDVKVRANGKSAVFYCRFHQTQGMQGATFAKKGGKPGTTSGDKTDSTDDGGYRY